MAPFKKIRKRTLRNAEGWKALVCETLRTTGGKCGELPAKRNKSGGNILLKQFSIDNESTNETQAHGHRDKISYFYIYGLL